MSHIAAERQAVLVVVCGIVCSELQQSSSLDWTSVLVLLSCAVILLLSYLPDHSGAIYRKNASAGILCCILLPVCLLATSHTSEVFTEKQLAVFAIGLLLISLVHMLWMLRLNRCNVRWKLAVALTIFSAVIYVRAICLNFTDHLPFCLPIIVQFYLQKSLPRWVPRSFTIGEAAVVTQGFVTFITFAICHYSMLVKSVLTVGQPLSIRDQELIFLQTAVMSCCIVICALCLCHCLRSPLAYYSLVCFTAFGFSLPVLAIPLQQDFVSWLVSYIYQDRIKISLFIYWSLSCITLWMLVYKNSVSLQLSSAMSQSYHNDTELYRQEVTGRSPDDDNGGGAKPRHRHTVINATDTQIPLLCCQDRDKDVSSVPATGATASMAANSALGSDAEILEQCRSASTVIRKQFHIAAITIFVPGLLLDINVLRMAVTCSFVVLVMFEALRILQIPPLGEAIHRCFQVFIDERDEGKLIMTHIYLLVGCSCPLWLQTGGGAKLFQYGGLVCLGVGDTVASFVGSKYGCLRWPNTCKTIEGSTAAFLSQLLCVYLLHAFNVAMVTNWSYLCLCLLLISLFEALTSQIDNLVLPLFTCLLFSNI